MNTLHWSNRLVYSGAILLLLLLALMAGALRVGAALPANELFYSRSLRGYPHVYTVDVQRGLSHLFVLHADPYSLTWSPDGTRIALAHDPNGRGLEIYSVGAYGGAQRLTFAEASSHSPRWTPDGKSIMFTGSAALVPQRWSIVDAAGGEVRPHPMDRLVDPRWERAWSPDGQHVAVVVRNYDTLRDDLLVIDTDCFQNESACDEWQRRIDPGPEMEYGIATLAWSPDSRWLAFSALTLDTKYRSLYAIEIETGVSHRLTRKPAVHLGPAWSPDGRQIAFVSNRTGVFQIYTVDSGCLGGDCEPYIRQLTHGLARSGQPAWSPDGQQIAYVSGQDGNREIYVMNADGSHQRRMTYDPFENEAPRWRP